MSKTKTKTRYNLSEVLGRYDHLTDKSALLPAPTTPCASLAPFNETQDEACKALARDISSVRFALLDLHGEAEGLTTNDAKRIELSDLWATVDHYLERIENAEDWERFV